MPESLAIIVKIHQGLVGFSELEQPWCALARIAGRHFLHEPAWYKAELEQRELTTNVYFVSVWRADALCAVIPLEFAAVKRYGVELPFLQLFFASEMGVNDLLTNTDLAPIKPLVLRVLREQLPRFWFIRWQCIPRSGMANALASKRQSIRYGHLSKYLDFSQGLEAFWAGYSKKFSKGLQKKRTKAQAMGVLRLHCAGNAAELAEAFVRFLEVEDSGWKGQRGSSIRQQPRKLAFYQRLLHDWSEAGTCRINLLYLADEVIAAQFGFAVAGTLYLLKIGFREDYATISPGYLLLEQLIGYHAGVADIHRISFVTGVNWIDRWHPQADPVGTFYAANGDALSRLLVCGIHCALAWRDKRTRRAALPANAAEQALE